MSVLLRGLSVEDAAGIAEIEGRLRLVRPPYQLSSSPELRPSDMDDAVQRGVMRNASLLFPNYVELISFLRNEHRNWAQSKGLPLDGAVEAGEFISGVGPAVICDVLDRVDSELIPAGLFEQAEALLLAIVQSKNVDQSIKDRAAAMVGRAYSLRKAKGRRGAVQIDRRIRDRCCVLELRA